MLGVFAMARDLYLLQRVKTVSGPKQTPPAMGTIGPFLGDKAAGA